MMMMVIIRLLAFMFLGIYKLSSLVGRGRMCYFILVTLWRCCSGMMVVVCTGLLIGLALGFMLLLGILLCLRR